MIEVKGREMVIPREEFNIGTTYDARSEMRHFHMRRVRQGGIDLAGLVFNLDLEYANGKTDTATLTKDVTDRDIDLMLTIEPTMLQVPGTVIIQIRALAEDGTVKWSSYKGAFFVEDCINTPGQYEGKITQLEQYEAEWGSVRDNVRSLNSRMDEIVKMADGIDASDVEKEVADVRVGTDGKKYESAGSAVREQIKADKRAIANLSVYVTPQMFSGENDTERIQKAVNASRFVYIPSGEYVIDCVCSAFLRLDGGVKVPSNTTIIMAEGATLKVNPNGAEWYHIFHIRNAENIRISGGNLVGDRDLHTYNESGTDEWGFGIDVVGGKNITIDSVNFNGFTGDAVIVGKVEDSDNMPENVTIHHCNIYKTRRNGISITDCTHCMIDNNNIVDTYGTDPENGIDIEPNVFSSVKINDVKIVNNIIDNFNGFGVEIYYAYDVLIDGNTINGRNNGTPCRCVSPKVSVDNENVRVVNNSFYSEDVDGKSFVIGSNVKASNNYFRNAIIALTVDTKRNVHDSIFNGNSCFDTGFAQSLAGGAYTFICNNVKIEGNQFTNSCKNRFIKFTFGTRDFESGHTIEGIIITDNVFRYTDYTDIESTSQMYAMTFGLNNSVVKGNYFIDVPFALAFAESKNLVIDGNYFINCLRSRKDLPLIHIPSVSANGNVIITKNMFDFTDVATRPTTYAIEVGGNAKVSYNDFKYHDIALYAIYFDDDSNCTSFKNNCTNVSYISNCTKISDDNFEVVMKHDALATTVYEFTCTNHSIYIYTASAGSKMCVYLVIDFNNTLYSQLIFGNGLTSTFTKNESVVTIENSDKYSIGSVIRVK